MACAASVPGVTQGRPSTRGYLYRCAGFADFIEVTRNAANLAGSLHSAAIKDGRITSRTLPFTRAVSGSQVSLMFNMGLGRTTALSGHFNADVLILAVPQASGQIA
jgi:hypothetical protein